MSAKTNWTLAIVGLLGGNLLAMGVLATTAHSRQAQIIPAYDVAAAHYDDTMAEAERSRALGWSATADLRAGSVEVRILDEHGDALRDARVRVQGYPRAHAVARFDVALVAQGDGRYHAPLPAMGWHDLTIVVDRGGHTFSQRVAVEAR
jgi:nitrogen fixation protein FixH